MAAKIRKGDKVIVLAGRDKGRTGEVIEVRPAQDRALVRGVNMVKRHQRQTAQQEGGIISKESAIHLVQSGAGRPKDGKPTRVGFKFVGEGTTARRCASPSVPESRSMADTQANETRSRRPQGGAPKSAKEAAPKGAKGGAPKDGDEPKVKKPRERSDYVARLRTHFEQVIRGELTKQFGYTNRMQVPVITKVVLNMGIGEGVADRKKVDNAAGDLTLIAGQKAVITKSRKSIATYKLRDGQAIGCKVTLRKTRMYDFIDRLVNIALPRIRDFRGLNPKSFDGRGNYSLGIKEHIVFPEIDFDKVDRLLGPRHHRMHQRAFRRRGARAAGRVQLPVPAVRGDSATSYAEP